MGDQARLATRNSEQVDQAKATTPLEMAFFAPHFARSLITPEFREFISQIRQAQKGISSSVTLMREGLASDYELEMLRTFARSLQAGLIGSPANVQEALESLSETWSSIDWPKVQPEGLQQIAAMIPRVSQLVETYTEGTGTEVELLVSVQRLEREVASLGAQIKRLPGRQATPPYPIFFSKLSAIELRWASREKTRKVRVTCGRRTLLLSLERAEDEVLLRLAQKMHQHKERYKQDPDWCGWVSYASLIQLLLRRSGSEEAAFGYLRKTVSDLRKKLVSALQGLDLSVDGRTVIQQQPHRILKQSSYRLAVPPVNLHLPKLPKA